MTFEIGFFAFKVDIFSMKIYIVVNMDVVIDVTYSRKTVNTCVVITLLLHGVIHRKTETSYDNSLIDS